MKTKRGFRLRNICGENVIVAEGIENIDFSRIISMNESAAYLWNKVQSIDFTANTLIDLLLEEYEVSREDAAQDVNQLIEQWQKAGIVED
ncbi:PqqD family protein [Xylanibacter brevis]|jgi:hypothetical protein|uniref:PqqD family protein n=1 Tax=Xylanibacter brevis TaxID=83231 RepID=UPI000487083A|nr:PqqD family protein [Xylanibacter brevis]